MNKTHLALALACLCGAAGNASALSFDLGNGVTGNFDSTITFGVGVRAKGRACDLILKDTSGLTPGGLSQPGGAGAPTGCTEWFSGIGDQGNLNYGKGDFFTTYLKGTHELLMSFPEEFKFMARASWLRDFTATDTAGYISVGNPPGVGSLTEAARDDLKFKARLLDLWVSKSFSLGGEQARVRAGNQVISWGESLFIPGGINQINALDFMRLSQPGTQLKEVFLPAPIVSFATGLGGGLNLEAFVQPRWNKHYLPPTGSYWSAANGLGKGDTEYGIAHTDPKRRNQFGLSLRWQPRGTQLNLGAYALDYDDKGPQFTYNVNTAGFAPEWIYPTKRKLYGVSANFPVGDWAVGTELSYRPRDAVSLNPSSFTLCAGGKDGHCYVDEKKFQWHLTGILGMSPSDYPNVLKLLGNAQTATLLAEAVVIRYPNLKPFYNGEPVSAAAFGWGLEKDLSGVPESVGTKTSWGFNFDFSWTYDGTVIPGWQLTPGFYYFHAVKGYTPNPLGNFLEGAKSVNFYLLAAQNPATWQVGLNYAMFFEGKRLFTQPYKDRNYFGAFVSRNF